MSKSQAGNIHLVSGKGSTVAGTGVGGEYWHIYQGKKRVGKVFINVTESATGAYPSIQIFINKTDQGKGIGTLGYKLACAASKHKIIYANMRKSNIPSIKAAAKAGFKEDPKYSGRQYAMVYRK